MHRIQTALPGSSYPPPLRASFPPWHSLKSPEAMNRKKRYRKKQRPQNLPTLPHTYPSLDRTGRNSTSTFHPDPRHLIQRDAQQQFTPKMPKFSSAHADSRSSPNSPNEIIKLHSPTLPKPFQSSLCHCPHPLEEVQALLILSPIILYVSSIFSAHKNPGLGEEAGIRVRSFFIPQQSVALQRQN